MGVLGMVQAYVGVERVGAAELVTPTDAVARVPACCARCPDTGNPRRDRPGVGRGPAATRAVELRADPTAESGLRALWADDHLPRASRPGKRKTRCWGRPPSSFP